MAPKRSTPKSKPRRRPTRPTPKPRPVKAHSPLGPVSPTEVRLVRINGAPARGGGPGGEAWRIEAAGELAGDVFINMVDEPPIGPHPSIQIFLNRKSQGRRIGRVSYHAACEASQYPVIYAHMRKSNIASRRAAEEAGFKDMSPLGYAQLILRWSRTC